MIFKIFFFKRAAFLLSIYNWLCLLFCCHRKCLIYLTTVLYGITFYYYRFCYNHIWVVSIIIKCSFDIEEIVCAFTLVLILVLRLVLYFLLKLKNILTHKFAEISIFLADILSISFDGLIFGYNGPQFQHKKLL